MGNMALDQNNDTSLEDFVRARFKKTKFVLSVCSGAVTLAKAGVLKGKRATTTKALWWWVTGFGKGVKVCIFS
jgi:putative intracellular protease/amidase